MGEILIANGSALASPQRMASTTDANSREEQHIRIAGGAGPANEAGSLTAAQPSATTPVAGGTVGGAADYSSVGNVTVAVFGTTHAGFNVVFEGSPDGGTTWFSLTAQDEATNTQANTAAIATNGQRLFSLSLFGLNRFRVRASARTSGTLGVVIAPGVILIEPVLAAVMTNPAGSKPYSLTPANAGVATATTTEALASLIASRNLTAAATATTQTVTSGKTLRILGFAATFRGAAATATVAIITLRAVLTGTVTATSPVVAQIFLTTPAVANSHVFASLDLGQFIELPSGASFGVSTVLTIANTGSLAWPTIYGIEF